MPQITIYLDEKTEKKMKEITKSIKISQSKWIADLIKEKLRDDWPESILNLSGAWRDFPSVDELRKSLDKNIKREQI